MSLIPAPDSREVYLSSFAPAKDGSSQNGEPAPNDRLLKFGLQAEDFEVSLSFSDDFCLHLRRSGTFTSSTCSAANSSIIWTVRLRHLSSKWWTRRSAPSPKRTSGEIAAGGVGHRRTPAECEPHFGERAIPIVLEEPLSSGVVGHHRVWPTVPVKVTGRHAEALSRGGGKTRPLRGIRESPIPVVMV